VTDGPRFLIAFFTCVSSTQAESTKKLHKIKKEKLSEIAEAHSPVSSRVSSDSTATADPADAALSRQASVMSHISTVSVGSPIYRIMPSDSKPSTPASSVPATPVTPVTSPASFFSKKNEVTKEEPAKEEKPANEENPLKEEKVAKEKAPKEPEDSKIYLAKCLYKAASSDEISLQPGQEVMLLKKTTKTSWEMKIAESTAGTVNPDNLIEITKYGLTKAPKIGSVLETYVAISTPPDAESKDSLPFNIGDEIKVISKELKTGEWLGICGSNLGKLSSEGLFKL